jgi:hypothetical protein
VTLRRPNESNACVICGEQVTTRARMRGFVGYETAEGEIIHYEGVVVAHPECYMRTPPAERNALIERIAEDWQRATKDR